MKKFFLACVMAVGLVSAASAFAANETLVVFHAGSLSVSMKQAAAEFEKKHPGVKVQLEAAGSVACARKIIDLNQPCDLFASADYAVIDTMLIPAYAAWSIKFASDEIVIGYTGTSKYGNEINASNWFEVLLRKDVAYGRSDPNLDPCGYRTEFVTQLAETHYAKPGLSAELLKKDVSNIRPKSTDLLAILETNTVDYLFMYRSVAIQHGLHYVTLPKEVNLGDMASAQAYAKAASTVTGKSPGTTETKKGEPIIFGLTVPENALHKELALQFAEFLLEQENGLRIFKEQGQTICVPSTSASYHAIPEELKKYATK
jgi:molybdate/tungstate transport system substrate-binding protein